MTSIFLATFLNSWISWLFCKMNCCAMLDDGIVLSIFELSLDFFIFWLDEFKKIWIKLRSQLCLIQFLVLMFCFYIALMEMEFCFLRPTGSCERVATLSGLHSLFTNMKRPFKNNGQVAHNCFCIYQNSCSSFNGLIDTESLGVYHYLLLFFLWSILQLHMVSKDLDLEMRYLV